MAYNSGNEKPKLVPIITANKCDANGNTEFRLNMDEISYTPNSLFNLFII